MKFQISGVELSAMSPVFCIAEAGVNHNGDLSLAKELIDAAAESGASAVKFQTFSAVDLVTPQAQMAPYQKVNTGKAESQLEMLRRLELSEDDHFALKEHASQKKIIFLSTPHSGPQSLRLLIRLGVPALKIGSGDLTNLPFLIEVGASGIPVILSTGMGTMQEVSEAVTAVRSGGATDLVVLHCTTSYPCKDEEVNLGAMTAMGKEFQVAVGYSDHTTGVEAADLAVRLGAVCIEKHITISRDLPGPDQKASMEPNDFKNYVEVLRKAKGKGTALRSEKDEILLGTGAKVPTAAELEVAMSVRKSLMTTKALAAGSLLTPDAVTIKRPATGILPKELSRVIGMKVTRDLSKDSPIRWEDLS